MSNRNLGEIEPIKHGVNAGEHPPVINMHRYFAKRPADVFENLIKHYSNENNIIFDPFIGGGITAVKALETDRKIVAVDLNPLATFITKMEIENIDIEKYKDTFEKIRQAVIKEIMKLYETDCPQPGCKKKPIAHWFGWNVVLKCSQCGHKFMVRHGEKILNKAGKGTGKFKCPKCKKVLVARIAKDTEDIISVDITCGCGYRGSKEPSKFDKQRIKEIEKDLDNIIKEKELWYPTNPVPDGDKTRELLNKNFAHFYQLFTPRNLLAIAMLLKEIKKIKDKNIQELMVLTLSETMTDTSKLSGSVLNGWEAHAYWVPNEMYEVNVWERFERRFGYIVDGKQYSKKTIGKKCKFASSFKNLQKNDSTVLLLTTSSSNIPSIENKSIDAIITDPPYGGNVNYTELSNFWTVWIDEWIDDNTADGIINNKYEAIKNKTQKKEDKEYQELIYSVFKECYRVLKPDRWMVMTFHNRNFKIWKALHTAAYDAGFILPENFGIVYQTPIKKYTSTFHQKAGGAMLGDFIVSFKRAAHPPSIIKGNLTPGEERKILDEIKKVIEYHAGATESLIMTQLMPFLMISGLLHKVASDDLTPFLKKNFKKIDDKWYPQERIEVDGTLKPILQIPAEERIEYLIRSLLKEKKFADIDDILKVIYMNLTNGTTPTDEEVMDVLHRICYEHKDEKGRRLWNLIPQKKLPFTLIEPTTPIQKRIKKEIELRTKDEGIAHHDLAIGKLYEIGTEYKYHPHIGQTEQRKNKEFTKISYPLTSGDEYGIPKDGFQIIKEIDICWMKGKSITHAFEVVTSMGTFTEAINRFENLYTIQPNSTIECYIVVDEIDKPKALNKLDTPAYRQRGISEKVKIISIAKLDNFLKKVNDLAENNYKNKKQKKLNLNKKLI